MKNISWDTCSAHRAIIWSWTFLALVVLTPALESAPLEEARVSRVIQDVRLLSSNAAARPAAVNDDVKQGTAVRTAAQSRAELTFTDLTITRIGENTVFSFKGGSREVSLDSGAILLQVPQGGEAAKIRTAAVTASISGGTGLMNSNKGFPTKLYILEGIGELCLLDGECVTAHGGEMVMENGGQLFKAVKFNGKLLFKTSPLLYDFPPLPNEWLIFLAFDQNGQGDGYTDPNKKDLIDIIDQKQAGSPGSSPPPGATDKFGPPSTITSPDPYVIGSGTQINTDPTITTNGVTNQGKLYRGNAVDGVVTQYLFGQAPTAFDNLVFNGPQNNLPVAIFKFAHLQLAGDPTVTVPSGATTFLALVSVGDITSGGPGGILNFAGITRLSLITQAGSITLGPGIGFANLSHLEFYARGGGSNLTLGSAISNVDVVKLYAGGSVQVNGDVTANSNFVSLSGGDFLAGSGIINAPSIDIESLANVNIDGLQFRDVTGDVTGVAGATFNLTLYPDKGNTAFFPGTSFTVQGNTINVQTTGGIPTTFDLETATVSFTAGSGGIQASNILFANGNSLLLQTTNGGDINIYGRQSPSNGHGGNESIGMIDASGAVNATGNITNTGELSAGTSISVGGNLGANTVTAGTTLHVKGDLYADTVNAGGNIDANGVQVITINAPTGLLTVGSDGITPVRRDGPSLQHTFNVNSIISSGGIDFIGNQFNEVPGFDAGGRLTINATHITFDSEAGIAFANFNGADQNFFDGKNPPVGGDGGTFIINTTGDITAVNGADITATTGNNYTYGAQLTASGAGGTVELHSSGGSITLNNMILVSSNDDFPKTYGDPYRESASGGTILLQSDLTTGQGIAIGANAQLLSLLDDNAPGPGGSITLSTMGSDITVNGTIEADRGTITMDQNDPVGPPPLITIDGATLISDTLNVHSAGNLNVAETNETGLYFSTATLHADQNITLNVGNIFLSAEIDSIAVTAGNTLNLTGGGSEDTVTLSLNLTNNSSLNAGAGGINAPFVDIGFAGAELNVVSGGNITAHSITFTDSYARGMVSAAGAISINGELGTGSVSAGTSVGVGGSIFASVIDAGTTISAGDTIQAGLVTAGGNISANITRVQNITSPTGLLTVTNMIRPDVFSTDPMFPEQGAKAPHVYSVASIITPNGIDFSGNQFGGINGYSSGGLLTIHATTLTFNSGTGIGAVNFNGADAGALDFQGMPFTLVGGDGGTFIANAIGDISTSSNAPISATTGLNDPNLSEVEHSGVGGTVELHSTNGEVSVNSRIEVSSAEPTSTIAPFRSSARGGNIAITSGKTSGTAIQINSSAQLLAYLDNAAPGPGGKITILASKPGSNGGNNSSINIDNAGGEPGAIVAERGTVDIRHEGAGGAINITSAFIAADIVKIGALGDTGTLTIDGGGSISADTILKLYAPGSSGTLHFTADVTLSSGTAMHLAANTITIDPGFIVSINGAGGAAHIYTDHPDYSFTPGGGYTGPPPNASNGSFGGTNGALDPVPVTDAPPFDDVALQTRNRQTLKALKNRSATTRNERLPALRHEAPAATGRSLTQ